MTTAVIVLNYNRPSLTIRCLDSMQRQVGDDWFVVVVDNGSSDGSAEKIDQWLRASWRRGPYLASAGDMEGDLHPHRESGGSSGRAQKPDRQAAILLRLPRNVGYGAGNNAGIQWATSNGCNDVWIVNNDVVVDPSAISILASRAALLDAVIGCTILRWDDVDLVECVGGAKYSWWTSRSSAVGAGSRWDSKLQVDASMPDYVAGAAMYLTAGVLARVGLLREDLFLYFEEIDYAERCRANAVPIDVCSRAVVWHEGGATTGGHAAYGRRSQLSAYYSFRSAIAVTGTHRPLCLATVGFFRCLQAFRFLVTGHGSLSRAALRGIRDGLRLARRGAV